mmetsp:Transcript_5165/g.12395  ORF Transcript_5165/g.12395 Transcript_5165/m.12395 type:complete len:208 (-) Transcript_5165:1344-1967(-)
MNWPRRTPRRRSRSGSALWRSRSASRRRRRRRRSGASPCSGAWARPSARRVCACLPRSRARAGLPAPAATAGCRARRATGRAWRIPRRKVSASATTPKRRSSRKTYARPTPASGKRSSTEKPGKGRGRGGAGGRPRSTATKRTCSTATREPGATSRTFPATPRPERRSSKASRTRPGSRRTRGRSSSRPSCTRRPTTGGTTSWSKWP